VRDFLIGQFPADNSQRVAPSAPRRRMKLANFSSDVLVLASSGSRATSSGSCAAPARAGEECALLVVVLSPEAAELAELRAFREGSDDYLRKPVSYPLLLARMAAIVRRSDGRPIPRRRIGVLEIDPLERRVAVAERPVHLSRMEFELLSHLAVEPTRVYTKEQLLREVWGFKALGNTRTVDAHACRLCTKLALAGAPNLVANVRGVGYRLCGGPVVSHPKAVAAPLSTDGRAA
jgi:DNA-binding response OmpR family regulator